MYGESWCGGSIASSPGTPTPPSCDAYWILGDGGAIIMHPDDACMMIDEEEAEPNSTREGREEEWRLHFDSKG